MMTKHPIFIVLYLSVYFWDLNRVQVGGFFSWFASPNKTRDANLTVIECDTLRTCAKCTAVPHCFWCPDYVDINGNPSRPIGGAGAKRKKKSNATTMYPLNTTGLIEGAVVYEECRPLVIFPEYGYCNTQTAFWLNCFVNYGPVLIVVMVIITGCSMCICCACWGCCIRPAIRWARYREEENILQALHRRAHLHDLRTRNSGPGGNANCQVPAHGHGPGQQMGMQGMGMGGGMGMNCGRGGQNQMNLYHGASQSILPSRPHMFF